MKGFLFDENLPRRLTFDRGLPVTHATELGDSPTDTQLWEYAKSHELAIVSKDADFSNRMMLQSSPPWVVHLRFGNQRLSVFHKRLEQLWPLVKTRLPDHKLIAFYPDRIEAVRDE